MKERGREREEWKRERRERDKGRRDGRGMEGWRKGEKERLMYLRLSLNLLGSQGLS